jgi:MFS family permease
MEARTERITPSLWQPAFVVLLFVQFALVTVNGGTTMALPAVKADLGATNSNLQWFAALFGLGFALVLVISGRLGDLFGTRRLLLIGYGGLVVAALLASTAPNIWLLLVARLIQGIAGGVTAPQLSAMIQRMFSGHARTRAFAVLLTVAGGSFMVGQLSTGALISANSLGLSWRWAFIPFIPFGIVTWVIAVKVLPPTLPGVAGRLDIAGATVLGLVAFLFMFPLIQGRNAGWPLWVFAMIVASVPAFLAFMAYERRLVRNGGDPLVDPALFKIRSFRTGNVITLLVGLLSAAAPLYLVLTIQIGFGRNALQAALLTCPMPLANMVGSLSTAPLLRRFGRMAVAVGAMGTAAAAIAILVAIGMGGVNMSPIALVPGIALIGYGLGVSITAGIAIVLAEVPHANAGSASGVQSTGLQLSGAIGIAVYGIAFYGAIGGSSSLGAYLDGISLVMWLTILLTIVQVVMMFSLPRHTFGTGEDIPISDPELLILPDVHG